MKIVEIATGYTPIPAKVGAATEIVIENLISEFNKIGFKNELIDISYDDKSNSNITKTNYIKLSSKLDEIKDNSSIHYLRRIIYSIKLGLFLRKYLKKQESKVILHFHNQFNYFFSYIIAGKALQQKEVRTIYTIHSPGWSVFKKIPNRLYLEKYAIKNADITISLTETIKNNVIKLVDIDNTNRIKVIPNGVSPTTYFPRTNTKENYILNIGSICDRKNQLETIRTLTPFLKEHSYKFIFAGKIIEPEYFEMINTFISNNKLNDYIQYLGEVSPGSKLNHLYNLSKFYISHSKQEAFSLVVLESMASGLPVILSSNFNFFIDKNEALRKVIKILNKRELLNELNKLIESKAQYNMYRKNQIDLIKKSYSWNSIAKQIIQNV